MQFRLRTLLIVLALVLGGSLMIGETIRSWGQGRHILAILDDFFVGIPLIVTGILMAKPTPFHRCAFSASFAATAGMLYGSFFSKLVEPSQSIESNIQAGVLTGLIGLAFAGSLLGVDVCR